MKASSKCKNCGEEILKNGNYEFNVIKAKRIPKKARKLMQEQTEGSSSENHAALSQTKFGRFLLKRSKPRNVIEITCGHCSSSSRIVMKKPTEQYRKRNSILTTPPSRKTPQIDLTGSKKKRKKKKKKDLTAGLCIPLSLNSSMSRSEGSVINAGTPTNASTSTPTSSSSAQSSKVSKFMVNQTKAMKATAAKQKEMDNLRKVLFKSKKNPPNSGASLKDFLSSM